MKLSKKILAVSLSLIMLLGMVAIGGNGFADVLDTLSLGASAADATSGTCGDNLTWNLDDEGTLTITGTGDMYDYSSEYDVPWYSSCEKIKNISISAGVTSISDNAFSDCTFLSTVDIPDSVADIGSYAFSDCSALTAVTIPAGIACINDGTFSYCTKLETVNIPDSVTEIGEEAFRGCTSLAVVAGNGISSIRDYAFYGCSSLTDVTFSSEMVEVYNYAFEMCTKLTDFNAGSVDYAGWEAFDGCNSLKEIKFSETVSIDEAAFYGCSSLTSIDIPCGDIMDMAFYGCTGLTSVTISKVGYIGFDAFGECSGIESIDIPDGTTFIGCRAFHGCTNLADVNLPDSITKIGDDAFYSTAYYDNESNWIDGALYSGSNLISVDKNLSGQYSVKEGTTCIAASAFKFCSEITDVYIPESVTSVTQSYMQNDINGFIDVCFGMFAGCTSLKSVTVDENNSVYDSRNNCNAIIETSTDTLIAGCNNTVIPDSVKTIYGCAFTNCDGLKNVSIPNGVEYIYEYAFSNCTDLISITISETVAHIEDAAFYGCSGLSDIDVDENNPVYDSRNNCNAIIETETNFLIKGCENTIIPGNVTGISGNAFEECYGLTNINIPAGITYIGPYAFEKCVNLKSVTLPGSLNIIDSCTFENCPNLTDVYYTGSASDRAKLSIGDGNEDLENATWHYNYDPGTAEEQITKSANGASISYSEGTFDDDENVVLNVEVLTEEETRNLKDNIIKGIGSDTVYNIYPSVDGEPVQPNGKVKVTLPIGQGYDKSRVKVFHYIDENGTLTKETIRNEDITFGKDYIEFYVTHFSYFVLDLEPVINVAASKTVDYRTKTTIKATATGVPEGYYLVMNVNGTEVKGTNTSVEYNAGELKGNLSYTVRIVDGNGNTQTDSDGNAITNGSSVNCKAGFLQKLIAFFKGLFGSLPTTTIQP